MPEHNINAAIKCEFSGSKYHESETPIWDEDQRVISYLEKKRKFRFGIHQKDQSKFTFTLLTPCVLYASKTTVAGRGFGVL